MTDDRVPPKSGGQIMREEEYEDSYGTCVETFSTLRIFSDELGPEEIGRVLGLEANDGSFRKGEVHGGGKLRRKANGWFYSTKGLSDQGIRGGILI